MVFLWFSYGFPTVFLWFRGNLRHFRRLPGQIGDQFASAHVAHGLNCCVAAEAMVFMGEKTWQSEMENG